MHTPKKNLLSLICIKLRIKIHTKVIWAFKTLVRSIRDVTLVRPRLGNRIRSMKVPNKYHKALSITVGKHTKRTLIYSTILFVQYVYNVDNRFHLIIIIIPSRFTETLVKQYTVVSIFRQCRYWFPWKGATYQQSITYLKK